jgi:ketosteroid isomerase-like protein
MSDEPILRQLNERYIASYLEADVEWYREHLAEDFLCIESDGSVLDKAQFLHKTAAGPDVASYRLEQVRIRMFGDVALVHGKGLFQRSDKTTGTSRYTDVYLRAGGQWKAIAAQITRTTSPRAEAPS